MGIKVLHLFVPIVAIEARHKAKKEWQIFKAMADMIVRDTLWHLPECFESGCKTGEKGRATLSILSISSQATQNNVKVSLCHYRSNFREHPWLFHSVSHQFAEYFCSLWYWPFAWKPIICWSNMEKQSKVCRLRFAKRRAKPAVSAQKSSNFPFMFS